MTDSPFRLRRPCSDCPFRADRPGFLSGPRAEGIVSGVVHGDAPFHCHKTVHYDDDDDGEAVVDAGSQFCAGALLLMEREHTLDANVYTRLGLFFGRLDPASLDRAAPVDASAADFIQRHSLR